MIRIVHTSDPHYTGDRIQNTIIDAAFDRIHQMYPDAFVSITGDITDNGKQIEYQQATSKLSIFGDKLIVCPGNHDECIWGNFYNWRAKKRFEESFHNNSWPKVTLIENIAIITLDSVAHTISPMDFACGRIGYFQRQRLNMLLDLYKGYTIIIFVHHHPFYHNKFMKLLDADEFIKICMNRVNVLGFGHNHICRKYENIFGIDYALAAGKTTDANGKWLITSNDDLIHVERI